MSVTDCFAGGKEYTSDTAPAAMICGDGSDPFPNNAIGQLRIAGALCNAAEFDASTTDRPLHLVKMHGDPTDQAILRFSESLGSVRELRNEWKKVFELAFNSRNKFMIRIMSPLAKGTEKDGANMTQNM